MNYDEQDDIERNLTYGELRQRDSPDSEFKLKHEILENDERVGSSFKYTQIKDNGRIKEVAIYNKHKEFITKSLKLANLSRYSSSHQWANVRVKLIRLLMFIDQEEGIDFEEVISTYVDGLNANLNLSLSVDKVGFDGLIKQAKTHDIRERRVDSYQGRVKPNALRDDLR